MQDMLTFKEGAWNGVISKSDWNVKIPNLLGIWGGGAPW